MRFVTREIVRRRCILLVLATFAGLIASSCFRAPQISRANTTAATRSIADISESDRAAIVVCHDTLGRPDGLVRRVVNPRCAPCISITIDLEGSRSLSRARRLWAQRARAPYDETDPRDVSASCTALAYEEARDARPRDDSLLVEIALFRIADVNETKRWAALHELDDRLQALDHDERAADASALLAMFARGMWDRAQRQLERPADLSESKVESRAHDLAAHAQLLHYLPAIPQTSAELGVSEAEWVARLFTTAALRSPATAARSQLYRLALAPWVALKDWVALDSAALALLRSSPRDSALLPALALSAYRRLKHPVADAPLVMRLFDSALVAMPRADSIKHDGFDGVLSQSDDDWRYGFSASDRALLDARGWAVIDPLWTTPVNEIRLARRARIAEANFLYADIAPLGTSGSDTRPGQLLQRLGSPDSRWRIDGVPYNGRRWLRSGWPSMMAVSEIDDDEETWRVFYGTAFSPSAAAMFKPDLRSACVLTSPGAPALFACALNRQASWNEVPFYATNDTIDVTLARFRAAGDLADVYIGSRVPLRAFKDHNALDAAPEDRVTTSAWLTNETGTPLFHRDTLWQLPDAGAIAAYAQWRAISASGSMMHRVEAMESSRLSSARGVAQFTSDAAVEFPLRGFGMSDVLVAASAIPAATIRSPVVRWSDLIIQPNGAVVAPAQRFAIAWEVYDLQPGADGRVRWRVQLRRERGTMVRRDDMQDVLMGTNSAGSKVLASESEAPDLSYTRDAPAVPVVLDNLVFRLTDAQVGRHVLRVRVDDLVSGKSVSRSVSVRVLNPDAQKRGTLRIPSLRR